MSKNINTKKEHTEEAAQTSQLVADIESWEAEYKKVEETLTKNASHFRSVVESASDGIISIDSDGNIIHWNSAAETIFGYSDQEAFGMPLISIIPERFRKEFSKGI